jgi:hypothetical protein
LIAAKIGSTSRLAARVAAGTTASADTLANRPSRLLKKSLAIGIAL